MRRRRKCQADQDRHANTDRHDSDGSPEQAQSESRRCLIVRADDCRRGIEFIGRRRMEGCNATDEPAGHAVHPIWS